MIDKVAAIRGILEIMNSCWDLPSDCNEGELFTYAEVLFDRICRENGIEHLLTQPRSPTTTGKIERFHKTLRLELDTRQVFKDITTAQEAMDEWVEYYNTQRPHRSLDDGTPSSRFKAGDTPVRELERNGDDWISRKVTSNGIVCVGYQKVNVGQRHAGFQAERVRGVVDGGDPQRLFDRRCDDQRFRRTALRDPVGL